MNSINFVKYPDFPLNSDTMDFLMKIIYSVAELSALGGENYILSGCEETETQVADGWIVVRGELMYFVGGTKQEDCRIVEEALKGIEVNTTTYDGIEIKVEARFGGGTDEDMMFKWSSLKRVKTLTELTNEIRTLEQELTVMKETVANQSRSITSLITSITDINNRLIDVLDTSEKDQIKKGSIQAKTFYKN